MEIKTGEYVRTKQGYIAKLEKIFKGEYYMFDDTIVKNENMETDYILKSQLEELAVKHSPDIIDLIKIGDYVNQSRVVDVVKAEIKAVYTEDIKQHLSLIPIENKQIKSVVTKEMIENIKYEV